MSAESGSMMMIEEEEKKPPSQQPLEQEEPRTDIVSSSSNDPTSTSPVTCASWKEELWKSIQTDANQAAIDLVQYAFDQSSSSRPSTSTLPSSLLPPSHGDDQHATILMLQIVAQRILVQIQAMSPEHKTETDPHWMQYSLPSNINNYINPGVAPSEESVKSPATHPAFSSPIAQQQQPTRPTTVSTTSSTTPPIMTVTEGLQLPVEKLCPRTGAVLQSFASGVEAQKYISKSTQPHFFWYSVQGKNKGTPPHIYKRFFWRLQGSDHLPDRCPCHSSPESSSSIPIITTTTAVRSSTSGVTVVHVKPSDEKITPSMPPSKFPTPLRRRRDRLRDAPVEMVDVETHQVVHTFNTAQEAHVMVSGSGVAQFGNFKKVLLGDPRFPHSIYKGYLFRLVGSNKLPPPGYQLKRPPSIALNVIPSSSSSSTTSSGRRRNKRTKTSHPGKGGPVDTTPATTSTNQCVLPPTSSSTTTKTKTETLCIEAETSNNVQHEVVIDV